MRQWGVALHYTTTVIIVGLYGNFSEVWPVDRLVRSFTPSTPSKFRILSGNLLLSSPCLLLEDMEAFKQFPFVASPTFAAAGVVASILLSWLTIAVHRLFFHPLAAFPGPKLAAITVLYEAYFDVWKGGKYIFKLNELHRKYGKIPKSSPTVSSIHQNSS